MPRDEGGWWPDMVASGSKFISSAGEEGSVENGLDSLVKEPQRDLNQAAVICPSQVLVFRAPR